MVVKVQSLRSDFRLKYSTNVLYLQIENMKSITDFRPTRQSARNIRVGAKRPTINAPSHHNPSSKTLRPYDQIRHYPALGFSSGWGHLFVGRIPQLNPALLTAYCPLAMFLNRRSRKQRLRERGNQRGCQFIYPILRGGIAKRGGDFFRISPGIS